MNDKSFEAMKKSRELGELLEWRKWMDEMPYLNPKKTWNVKALPPFRGAVTRYEIQDKYTKSTISVFLDCYNILGIWRTEEEEPQPYWEVYAVGEDAQIQRFDMEDIEEMEEAIEAEFKRRRTLIQNIAARLKPW